MQPLPTTLDPATSYAVSRTNERLLSYRRQLLPDFASADADAEQLGAPTYLPPPPTDNERHHQLLGGSEAVFEVWRRLMDAGLLCRAAGELVQAYEKELRHKQHELLGITAPAA